jgi:hypothetical protein
VIGPPAAAGWLADRSGSIRRQAASVNSCRRTTTHHQTQSQDRPQPNIEIHRTGPGRMSPLGEGFGPARFRLPGPGLICVSRVPCVSVVWRLKRTSKKQGRWALTSRIDGPTAEPPSP